MTETHLKTLSTVDVAIWWEEKYVKNSFTIPYDYVTSFKYIFHSQSTTAKAWEKKDQFSWEQA